MWHGVATKPPSRPVPIDPHTAARYLRQDQRKLKRAVKHAQYRESERNKIAIAHNLEARRALYAAE